MVLFNNIPYRRMRLTSKVNLTKRFSEKYKHMRLITRLYSIAIINNYYELLPSVVTITCDIEKT